MLTTRSTVKLLFNLIIIFLLTTKSFANVLFYKCPEKILKVLKGQSSLIKKGSEIGINYIKFSQINSPFKTITVKFKEKGSISNAKIIILDKELKKNSLGYEIFEKFSNNKETFENSYNFITLDKTYAFTRKEYYWSSNKENKYNYEYESSGRCLKINKKEFVTEKKLLKITKKENKIKTSQNKSKSNFSKVMKGHKPLAMTWQGYNDLILGKIKFSEKDLLGRLEFNLPDNDGLCIGTYALSKDKGTWSIYCENKNVNASGILKWNYNEGSVSGSGKDNKGKKIKFKVASIN